MACIEMPNAVDNDVADNHRAEHEPGDHQPCDWNTKIGESCEHRSIGRKHRHHSEAKLKCVLISFSPGGLNFCIAHIPSEGSSNTGLGRESILALFRAYHSISWLVASHRKAVRDRPMSETRQ